jgi:thiol-disulfide isomerase/thioredoxin
MRKTSMVLVSLAVGSVLTLGGCKMGEKSAEMVNASMLSEAMGDTEVVLVAMHADWCGTCERMGPKLMEAMDGYDSSRVKFVKADLTDRANPAAKATLAGMGMEGLLEKNAGKTGLVYVVDVKTGEIISKIYGKEATVVSIKADVDAALAKVS